MLISLTERAVKEIKSIIQEQNMEPETALRVRVVGGGCSGFETKLDLDEVFDETKDIVFTDQGVTIAVDKRSALYIDGAIVDFLELIDKRGFSVTNPKSVSTCGCGKSFSM